MVACLCTKVDQWQTSRQQGALLRRLGRLLVAPTPTACGAVRAMAALVRNDGHLAGELVLVALAAVYGGAHGSWRLLSCVGVLVQASDAAAFPQSVKLP